MNKEIKTSLIGAAMAGLLAGGSIYTQNLFAGSSKSPDEKSCSCSEEKECDCGKKDCKGGKECHRGAAKGEKEGKSGCNAGGCGASGCNSNSCNASKKKSKKQPEP